MQIQLTASTETNSAGSLFRAKITYQRNSDVVVYLSHKTFEREDAAYGYAVNALEQIAKPGWLAALANWIAY